MTDENSTTTANIGLAIWRLKCFYETFVQGSTVGILLNFCAKNPPHRQAEKRCAKVSAPLQLLHIEARITSAAVSKRFRCRKNLQHICGLAKFPQESKLSEETSPIRASL